MARESIRIGCGGAFWGDSAEGPRQLVLRGTIDYLVLDYLAEITMSILARMKARDPQAGYASDFLAQVIQPLAGEIKARGIKVVTNAGGINPRALKAALEATLGDDFRIAAVCGDDLEAAVPALRERDVREMSSGATLPARLTSINAYLGAPPIAAALAAGADIVITGRGVDSALVLGPLMHEFGWAADDYDRLAAGSLAGHIIECGTQCTGGLFTDWQAVPGWDDMGYPIAECRADGSFDITKPPATGGLVNAATVGEQVVYEIGDPARYLLPDVTCDFSHVRLRDAGPDRVRVSGAKGLPPGDHYKACATWADGYRAATTLMVGGIDAAAKAARSAEALLARARRLFVEQGYGDFTETSVEILGNESTYGPHARIAGAREVVLKLGVRHPSRDALELFAREILFCATAHAPGTTGFAGGRPAVQPVVRLFSCLVPKSLVTVSLEIGDATQPVAVAPGAPLPPSSPPRETRPGTVLGSDDPIEIPLVRLAHGRSGDKGDSANIGILARRPEYLDVLRIELTADAVRDWFAHVLTGPVTRYEWPGLDGFNFVLEGALGGGGVASLRHDPQGKAFAQMLLDMPVRVPSSWDQPGGILRRF
ncbi:MAG: acyclic terpene utilization AtuA family protein [Gammaproteobacteria bacterium]